MLEQLYNAVFIGSIYALFALGFALVFSVLDILNLAHPTVFMLGAFIALFVIGTLGLPWFVALPIAVLVTGLFGIALDRVAFAPLRRRGAPALSSMISSLAVTLIVSSALGGLAGVLLAFAYNTLDSRMGVPLELRAFTVMVVGGMGSLPGTVIGAYVLGLGEVASLVYLPTELRDAFAFGLLFLVLVLRPTGLLGQKSPDRV